MLQIAPADLLLQGLHFINIPAFGKSEKYLDETFKKHFGATPDVLAQQWIDIQKICFEMEKSEKSKRGLKRFLLTHHFLFCKPKNRRVLACRFNVCENYCTGEHLWKWVRRIQALKVLRIRWMAHLDDPNEASFILVLDGTDFKAWEERNHPTLP